MAWTAIPNIDWEYSTTPETDDPGNADKYTGNHTAGIRTNADGTEIYVYCRMTTRTDGVGYGELNKTALEG